MADQNLQHSTEDDNLQPADYLTSSLASLHLRDEAVVTNENTNQIGDNPETGSVCPVVMSSMFNQSRQQGDISMAIMPESHPADQGKIKT